MQDFGKFNKLRDLMERVLTPDDTEVFIVKVMNQVGYLSEYLDGEEVDRTPLYFTEEETNLLEGMSENSIALLFGEYADEGNFYTDENGEEEEVPAYYGRKLEAVGVDGIWYGVTGEDLPGEETEFFELYPEDFIDTHDSIEYRGDTSEGFSLLAIDFC